MHDRVQLASLCTAGCEVKAGGWEKSRTKILECGVLGSCVSAVALESVLSAVALGG